MSFAALIEGLNGRNSPYPGLRSFDVAESHLFFGRDQQSAELVRRLEGSRFLAVIGVSGSGKSSLVRAGLIPALERGQTLEAGRKWRRVITMPGAAPFESLARDLREAGLDPSRLRESSHGLIETAATLPEDETLLLVVDQFEELFRYKDLEDINETARLDRERKAADAAEFVELLLESARHHPPIYVVLTMRSDYLGDCAEFRDLPETLNDCQYLVPRMTRLQRKDAIERPLGRARMSTALVQRLLNDVGDEPDLLPVMQHALMRTWNHWRAADPGGARAIDVEDYKAAGGFEGALNRHAEELLAAVPRDIAACIFKRLTARGRTRRERRDPATVETLWKVCGATTDEGRKQVQDVLDTFRSGQATFLRPLGGELAAGTYVDITHESLIRLWKTLHDVWLPEEQAAAKVLLEMAARAANRSELLTGNDLLRVEEWDRRRNKTAEWATHYVDASSFNDAIDYVQESRLSEQRRVRWRRLRWRGAAVLVVVTLAVLFTRQLQKASLQAQDASQRLQAAQAAAQQAKVEVAVSEKKRDTVQTELIRAQTELVKPEERTVSVSGVAVPAASNQAHVYIQVRTESDATRALELSAPLTKAGYLVPKPEIVSVGPQTSEVRYFRREDAPLADKLLPILAARGFLDVRAVLVSGFEESPRIRPQHIELWLAAENLPALVKHLDDRSQDARTGAGLRLASSYLGSSGAIAAVLDLLAPQNLKTLTNDGRINALLFLNATQSGAWTEYERSVAAGAVRRIRADPGSTPGPQTNIELARLEQKVNTIGQGSTQTEPDRRARGQQSAAPIPYSAELVDRIRQSPGVPYTDPPAVADTSAQAIVAIVLHDASAADSDAVVKLIRDGRPDLPGPLAHWVVRTDGRIQSTAPETRVAHHVGQGAAGALEITNSTTIGIEVVGSPSCADPRQVESLVRLLADIAQRWKIPSTNIFSHAEVGLPPGRKIDMAQQAPAIRQMVQAVRGNK